MPSSEFGTGKSIVVLAIVVGCFAILWPKIFYPMMQAAFSMTSPNTDGEEQAFRPRDRPPHLQPGMMDAHMRSIRDNGYPNQPPMKEGRPFPHPSSRQPVKPQTKSGGAMSIIMPVYTIGIVVFFVYTVMKLIFKKNPEAEKKPLVKDFHMDPDYHKFVCQQQSTNENKATGKVKSKVQEIIKPPSEQMLDERNGNFDEKDYEIYKLRKKLEETEVAMERIMKQMGAVSNCLSKACLLKDGTFTFKETKDALEASELFSSTPEMVKAVVRDSKEIMERDSEPKQENISPGISKPSAEPEEEVDEEDEVERVDDEADVDECAEEKPTENLEQSLKRDSSINSDNSSFEMLSQSLNGSSSGYIVTGLDSENGDVSESSEKAAKVGSFDSSDKISDDEPGDQSSATSNDDLDDNDDKNSAVDKGEDATKCVKKLVRKHKKTDS